MPDLSPVILTLRLASVTTLVLLIIGTPLAWWLARTRSIFKTPLEAIVSLPLVLPPTVIGFYLLVALGPNGFLGRLWQRTGNEPLVFHFSGLVVASIIYSLPFVVQPLQSAFEGIGSQPFEAAAMLRAGPFRRFRTIGLPLARRGFLTAMTLGFAHAVGEFGVVLMIGGSIPGRTRVLSIAIYDHVESMEYTEAHWLSAGLMLFSFLTLWMVYIFNRRFRWNPV